MQPKKQASSRRQHQRQHAPAVFRTEGEALNLIRSPVVKGTVVNAGESANWNELHSRFEMNRINHEEAYSLNGACTNWAGEFFSRMRRAEIGHHHHLAGTYMLRDAQKPFGGNIIAACQTANR
jgi:hypothetical protein